MTESVQLEDDVTEQLDGHLPESAREEGQIGSDDISAVVQAIDEDDDPDVRAAGVRALERLGSESPDLFTEHAIYALFRALVDEDVDVRLQAIAALETLGTESSELVADNDTIPELVRAVEDGDVGDRATTALEEIGRANPDLLADSAAVPDVVELPDEDEDEAEEDEEDEGDEEEEAEDEDEDEDEEEAEEDEEDEDEEDEEDEAEEDEDEVEIIDPDDHSVSDLKDWVSDTDDVDALEAVLEAEQDGKDRTTAVGALEDRLSELSEG